jgi:hypothetical protein
VGQSIDVDNPDDDDELDVDLVPFKRRRLILTEGPEHGNEDVDAMNIDGDDEDDTEKEYKSLQIFEKRYLGENRLLGVFRGYRIYLDRFDPLSSGEVIPANSLDTIGKLIDFFGGIVTDRIDARTTHIVVDENDDRRYPEITVEALLTRRMSRRTKPFIVTRAWVLESIDSRQSLDETSFNFDPNNIFHYGSDDEPQGSDDFMSDDLPSSDQVAPRDKSMTF